MEKKTLLAAGICLLALAFAVPLSAQSIYTQRPDDPEAVYFTPDNFHITADGKTDVSAELQAAIDKVKMEKDFGIVFIPEGTYRISKTIYIPEAVRLIGYGTNRPVIVLGKDSPGFQTPDTTDKGRAHYMFWFTSSPVEPGKRVDDAGAGTFYSALSNIDLTIEDGNPDAVALRTHYAQHSFISYCDIHIGGGKAGIFDVGNFLQEVRFFGGDYGIYTTKTSPGWQYTMLDTYFEGQRIAAIKTQEAGLTIIRLTAKDVPAVVEVDPNYWEKLFMQDCSFINVSKHAVLISDEGNANTAISMLNIACNKVPVFAAFRSNANPLEAKGDIYRVNKFVYGLQMDDLDSDPAYKTIFDAESLTAFPDPVKRDIPALPDMSTWVNLKTLGAAGDDSTDNTKAIQDAVDKYQVIYIPQGWYRVTETIHLKPNTVLIGLNPIATQIVLRDNTDAFSGFGAPVPLLEAPKGGSNIITGIGLSTGDWNARAVACKWMAGADSWMNDVKFIGGHGTLERGPYKPFVWNPRQPTRENRVLPGMDPAWDTQYWSVWVTDGGGGTFTNIWSANTFATSGFYVSNTSTPGRIFELSVEHHVRNEVRFNKVSNWKVYALQLEEESRESSFCQPLEIENCDGMLFANLYSFRVIRVKSPYPEALRTWSCRNIEFLNVHNYAQTIYTNTNTLYDINSDIEVRPWEFARLFISGNTNQHNGANAEPGIVQRLASGFVFADGACHDSKGNVYFCEWQWKRIYKWSVETGSLSLVADFPWEPLSLGCDANDNLLVVFNYNPQPGYMVDGKQETFTNPPDAAGTSFSGWGNSGFGVFVYSIDPNNPDETMQKLPTVEMGSVENIYKALYPSNRWRDGHDFNSITVQRPKECFLAPDGKTIIPICYDLARANALIEAFPGKPLYATNEYDKRVVKLDVSPEGYLSDLKYFVEKGEFSTAVDDEGNLYVADGNIYVYDRNGNQIKLIKIPERPVTITIGGADRKTLFVTTASELYSVRLE